MTPATTDAGFRVNTTLAPQSLEDIASDIRMRIKRTVEDIIHIGRGLQQAKTQLGYAAFGKWCDIQFPDMNRETRSKFMQVAERFGNVKISDNLSPSVYQLLSAPSVPDDVVADVVSRANRGEKVTTGAVRKLFKQSRVAPLIANVDPSEDLTEAEEEHPLSVLDKQVRKLLMAGLTVEDIEDAIHRTDSRVSWVKPKQPPSPVDAPDAKTPEQVVTRGLKAWKLVKMTDTAGVTASDLHHAGFSSTAVYSCLIALSKDIEREKSNIHPSHKRLPDDLINYESPTVPSRRQLEEFRSSILDAYGPLGSDPNQTAEVVGRCLNDVINVVRTNFGQSPLP